jgi:hypothetical protein
MIKSLLKMKPVAGFEIHDYLGSDERSAPFGKEMKFFVAAH